MYNYQANVVNIVDGDTLDVEVDLGFRISVRQRLRLLNVDTPEMRPRKKGRTEASLNAERVHAHEAKLFVEEYLGWSPGCLCPVEIFTSKGDSFGRWLAVVWPDENKPSLNWELVAKGYNKRDSYDPLAPI